MANRRLKSFLFGLILPFLVVVLWETLARLEAFPPSLTAPPTIIIRNLHQLIVYNGILISVLYSIGRLLIGVFLGSIIGCCTGIYLTQSVGANKLLSPFLSFLAPIPIVVWIPFVIMVFGTGEWFKLVLISLVAFFMIHIAVYQSVRSINRDILEIAAIYEKGFWYKVWNIFLPSSLPNILIYLRVVFAIGWVIIFFVEYGIAEQGTEGLGWFITDARVLGRIEDEFSGVFLLAFLGLLIDFILLFIHKRVTRWTKISSS
jgi:sulfonate transport system permease protein